MIAHLDIATQHLSRKALPAHYARCLHKVTCMGKMIIIGRLGRFGKVYFRHPNIRNNHQVPAKPPTAAGGIRSFKLLSASWNFHRAVPGATSRSRADCPAPRCEIICGPGSATSEKLDLRFSRRRHQCTINRCTMQLVENSVDYYPTLVKSC